MATRRDFAAQVAALALLKGTTTNAAPVLKRVSRAAPGHSRIAKITRRDETILRFGGCGFGFSMTWAGDDDQFMTLSDGTGFSKTPEKVFHSRLFRVAGYPPNLKFSDVVNYPDILLKTKELESDPAAFWGGGCLAVDGRIYHHLATSNHPFFGPDGSLIPDFYPIGSKLIYSADNGRTWRNQDGTSPVLLERWGARTRENMAFFKEEPPGSLSWLSFLQMGKNYQLNRDGYVYVYSPNGYADGTMNELVMFRAPRARVHDRSAYEFFTGVLPDGSATWTRDISAREVVHTFPRGWVNGAVVGTMPFSWVPSVIYNAPLGLYMMVNWGTGSNSQGVWFGKPSYLGFWVAPKPWGPFTQIHEEVAWTPGNDDAARAFMPQIAPKWISPDGKSFWLIWSDYQFRGPNGETENYDLVAHSASKRNAGSVDEADSARAALEFTRKLMPHYGMNVQRVDIALC